MSSYFFENSLGGQVMQITGEFDRNGQKGRFFFSGAEESFVKMQAMGKKKERKTRPFDVLSINHGNLLRCACIVGSTSFSLDTKPASAYSTLDS